MTNWELFLQTLPIIGQCLIGIFASIAFIILVIYALNYVVNKFEEKKNASGEEENQ